MTTALAPSLFKMHDGVNGINTSMQSNTSSSSSSSSSSSQEENAMLQRHQDEHTPAANAIDCNQNDNDNDDERMEEGGKQTNPKSLHNNKGEPNIFYASTNLSKFKIEALLRLFFIHSTYQSFVKKKQQHNS